MSDGDPLGYYRCLGVRHDAPASVIRAAYKTLAKELHPDHNKSATATADFQFLQQAYEVLSNEEKRRSYDANAAIPDSPVTREEQDDSTEQFEPVRCSKCNAISAQPKYKVFYRVFGWIYGATKTPYQGVFCSSCETKVALRCTAFTIVLGWWSLFGFFFTLEALFHNLVGGRFHEQNAKLQAHQAFYFAQSGRFDLARAVALSAIGLAEQARDKKSGSKDGDLLRELRRVLTNFVESLPPDVKRVKLKSTSDISNRRFAYQIALLSIVVVAVFGVSYAQGEQAAAAEAQRLERSGIEQERAAAIARRDEETLRKLEKPLPLTGVMPGSYYDADTNPPFKINNSPDRHTLLKLVKVSTGEEVVTVFIRAGAQINIAVPAGDYHAKIASGQKWYGDDIRFGPTTSYSKLDTVFSFSVRGEDLLGNEVTLTRVSNGNLSRTAISATDF